MSNDAELKAKSTENNAEQCCLGNGSAFYSVFAQLRLWAVALLGFFADYLSKSWAVERLGSPDGVRQIQDHIVLIEDWLLFRLVHNTGAVGGVASGKTGFLIVVSIIALGFLYWLFVCSKRSQWMEHIALGLLFGGAFGNMWDRVFNDGKVIDFIEVNLHFRPFNPWPTFNVADMFLCFGVGLLLLSMWRYRKRGG